MCGLFLFIVLIEKLKRKCYNVNSRFELYNADSKHLKIHSDFKNKGADHMGAYSVPSNKPFKTKNKLNKSKDIKRIKEGLSLIQSGKTVIDINNNSIVIIKDERK